MATERKKYPIRAEDYQLLEAVGQGVSASVHRALCIPLNEVVAIKILDFERKNCDLSNVSREAQTMILIDHPNVLKAHCSFVHDHTLWVVMPYMAGGSCLHILKLGYPNGFEEAVIATVLREVLKGLEYLHRHGHIHRDLKAGNILVDARGGIKLGDFGVSANLFDSGERQRTRNTLAGTPCWMAPEVLEQLHGHDFKADIWSFGITALELAHGHAPFSKYPPMKVLLMTLQNAPPGLDYERDKKFTTSFKQMIAMCLVKDPSKRPTAQKLLKQPFFKQARSNEYISRKILEGLPSLGARHKALKDKEEDLLAQKKMPDGKMEEISQNEYKRGISGWNFDIEDLKAQASLIPDNDDASSLKPEGCLSALMDLDTMQEKMQEGMTYSRSCSSNGDPDTECDVLLWNKFSCSPLEQPTCYQRSRSDGTDNELKAAGSSDQNVLQHGMHLNGNDTETCVRENCESELNEKRLEVLPTLSSHRRKVSTSSCIPDIFPAYKEESVKQQNQLQPIGICNGVSDIPIDAVTKACKSSTSNADDLDDKLKIPVIQQKGRFKVTSENGLPPLGLTKSQSLQVFSPFSTTSLPSPGDTPTNPPASSLFPQLHCILQANILQRDNILNLMRQVSTGDGSVCRYIEGMCTPTPSSLTEKSLLEAAYERDKELVLEVADLQWRLVCLQDELQKLKARNAQV